jgi:hypothetical protein
MATEKAAAAEEVERIALSAQLVDDKTASHLKEEPVVEARRIHSGNAGGEKGQPGIESQV